MIDVTSATKSGIFVGILVGVCGALTSGCSSSSPATQAAPAPSLCATDSRAQTYSAGMEQKGAAGTLAVKLESINPNPVIKGNNDWKIEVVDASGSPVSGATIAVKPYMPDHGHGSSIIPQVAVGTDPGIYDISLLNLFMPGIWQVTFDVKTQDNVSDSAVFTFCVSD